MTVQNAFEEFIHSRQLKGLADSTVKSYRLLTSCFIQFISPDFDMEDIKQTHIDSFIDSLYSRMISRATIATYIRNTRIFLRWYEKKHPVSYLSSEITVPKTPKKIIYLYSPEDIIQIFTAVESSVPWIVARNKAIIALMLDSGLRQCEVCSLMLEDINFKESRIKVFGKGSKERFVPLGSLSSCLLKEYLSLRPVNSPYVFLNVHNEQITCNTIKCMTHNMKKILPFEFSSHKLRHNFATNYLLNQYERFGQMDIYQLMVVMGHEDISTTRRYLHQANNILSAKTCISHLDKLFAKNQVV